MNVFVKPEQEVKVVIYVAKDTKGRTVAYNEGVAVPAELKISDPERHELVFRYPTYKDTTIIADKGLSINDDGDMALHANHVRFRRIVTLLKSWDFVDEKGQTIEISEEMIGMLDPVVAGAIVYGLDMALGLVSENG